MPNRDDFELPVENTPGDDHASRFWSGYILLLGEKVAAEAIPEEMDLLRWYTRFKIDTFYRADYAPRIYANPTGPFDRGHNTTTISLRPDGWHYWKSTFEFNHCPGQPTLIDLLRMIEGPGERANRFETWMAEQQAATS